MRELALFAGAGGGILGGRLLGWRTVCAVEIEPYPRRVLMQRQDDGCLDPFPIWDDVRTFDGRPWRGSVDIVTGGFPCQDISAAGKGAGIEGERSGMWREMGRIIGEVRPRFCLVENSPVLTSRGLGTVLGDLAALGYDARWGVLGAVHAGAPHKRERIWIVADSYGLDGDDGGYGAGAIRGKQGREPSKLSGCQVDVADSNRSLRQRRAGGTAVSGGGEDVADADESGRDGWGGEIGEADGRGQPENSSEDVANSHGEHGEGKSKVSHAGDERNADDACDRGWWKSEPDVGRVAHGVASRVDRLKGIGNGQVPAVVRLAWEVLAGGA